MLTDSEYIGHGYSKEYIKELLKKLSLLGPRYSVLSGVSFEKGKNGSAAYDRETGEFSFFFSDHVDGFYYGTGDVFASALLGAILNEKSVSDSIKIAVDFTIGAIRRTYAAGTDKRYGVHFESELPSYIRALGKL
jgi:pyridoxine kinase